MDQGIIHQVEENTMIHLKKEDSFCKKLCSRFSFMRFNKAQQSKPYSIEMESPKYQMDAVYRKTLVIDLDETLVHSSFKDLGNWDFTVQITVQGMQFKVYVSVRPGTYQFIESLAKYYDVVLFTASLKEYADPVMDILDPKRFAVSRLFREHCVVIDSQLVKDLRCLDKDLCSVIIIDNSAVSFKLQPENAFHIKDFFYDKTDNELEKLTHFLVWMATIVDVRPVSKFQKIHAKQFGEPQQSCKQSFAHLEQQFQQYEEQHIQSTEDRLKNHRQSSDKVLLDKLRVTGSSSRQELIELKPNQTSMSIIKNKPHQKTPKTMTVMVDSSDVEEQSLRHNININSPVNQEVTIKLIKIFSANKDGIMDDEQQDVKKLTNETDNKDYQSLQIEG